MKHSESELADRAARIRALAGEGKPYRRIAAEVGCSPATVSRTLQKPQPAGKAKLTLIPGGSDQPPESFRAEDDLSPEDLRIFARKTLVNRARRLGDLLRRFDDLVWARLSAPESRPAELRELVTAAAILQDKLVASLAAAKEAGPVQEPLPCRPIFRPQVVGPDGTILGRLGDGRFGKPESPDPAPQLSPEPI